MNWVQWFTSHSSLFLWLLYMKISVNLIGISCFPITWSFISSFPPQAPLESVLFKARGKKASVYFFNKYFLRERSNELIHVLQWLAHTKYPINIYISPIKYEIFFYISISYIWKMQQKNKAVRSSIYSKHTQNRPLHWKRPSSR